MGVIFRNMLRTWDEHFSYMPTMPLYTCCYYHAKHPIVRVVNPVFHHGSSTVQEYGPGPHPAQYPSRGTSSFLQYLQCATFPWPPCYIPRTEFQILFNSHVPDPTLLNFAARSKRRMAGGQAERSRFAYTGS